MNNILLHARWLIVFALLGSGCSSLPQGANGGANSTLDDQSSLLGKSRSVETSDVFLAPLGKVAVGEVATLSAENPLGVTRVRVVDEYQAASGRLCRRITIAETQPRLRLVCREPGSEWSLVRGLIAAK